jgi:DNA-binding IclR family transcriptional regulator
MSTTGEDATGNIRGRATTGHGEPSVRIRSDEKTGQSVPRSAGRVLDLLEIVLDERTCTLTEAATASGLTPTTALRHLRALEARGYVERDDSGRFSVGPTMRRLAAAIGDVDPVGRLVAAAQPLLDAAARDTGESVYLAVSDGSVATYVATAESPRAIRHVGWIGQTVTLDGTAVGDALRSPGTCVTRTGAVEPDITATSLAIPATDHLGVALSVIGPTHRFTEAVRDDHERVLRHTTDRFIRQLGGRTEAVAS